MRSLENWSLGFCYLLIIGGLLFLNQGSLAGLVVVSDLIVLLAAVQRHSEDEPWIRLPFLRIVLTLSFVLMVGGVALHLLEWETTVGGAVEAASEIAGGLSEISIFLFFAMLLAGLSLPSWEKS